ncbi:MAG: substrate-binding domain-containing protein, partial [Lachnospiraceae bacterium]|nr:substrate-binding domain-containing protein [Lachnospiraceae bacterium]
MVKNKRVIGVCLTRLHDTTRTNYIKHLHEVARRQGYKLIIFNSLVDFYHKDAFDEGAKVVYDIINFELIDALIVYAESFCDRSIVESIINSAKDKGMPVIIINEEREDCYSVIGEYGEAFKSILRHVINVHGMTDTFFVAGNREHDTVSQYRIQCYREVLEENGLPFEEERVGYGGYWETPTRKTMESLLEDDKKPPQAIFCANDSMALTVCKVLNEYGYHVPKDVLVTGFDGIPASRYCRPQLTTCSENLAGLAELSIEAANLALEQKVPCCVLKNPYVSIFSESCGCKMPTQENFRDDLEYLFYSLNNMEAHEENTYTWIDRMLGIKDMNSMYRNLSGCILEDSYVCLNSDFVASAMKENVDEQDNRLSDGLVIISSKYSRNDPDKTETMQLSEMVPDLWEWIEDETLYVLTAVHAGKEVCGYYAVKTDNIMSCRHKIKRVSKTINVACNVAINHFRQMKLRLSVESATMTNSVTGLPNLKGAVKWFEGFSALEENHQKALSISVYGLPKYTYIYENYGIQDVEE